MATAELAVAMPAVVVALTAVLSIGQAVLAQVSCVDSARAGARAAARGEPAAVVAELARGGQLDAAVTLQRHGSLVTVSVSRRLALLLDRGPVVRVGSRAVAQVESSGEAGSVTVLLLAVCLVGVLLATAGAGVGSAVVARHRAQAAADLGALAAADVLVGRAAGQPCAAAVLTARHNGARVTSCQVTGTDVLVRTSVSPRGPIAALGHAVAVARAGAAEPTGVNQVGLSTPGASAGGLGRPRVQS